MLITKFPLRPATCLAGRMYCSTSSEISVTRENRKRILTLNRPKALNALNLGMVRDIYPYLQKWNHAGDVDMVIMKGAGDKAFCAGGDVLAVIKAAKEAQNNNSDITLHKDFFREEYKLNHLIGTLSKPYIAFIDGIVLGGGCGLSVNGRFRVATERTMLAMPETALGLFPDVGGSYFLSRLKNNLGMYLALTGYRLQAADAFHAGLATHYVLSEDMPALEKELIKLDNVSETSVDAIIRSFEPKELPAFSLEEHLLAINRTFYAKSVEGILENLKKENSEWAQKQLKTLGRMSPTSLKITFKQIESGARTPFAKVFTVEYRLSQRFLADNDFHEGCRAILVDKDRKPKWKPATLAEVTEDIVDKYFAPLPRNMDLILHDDPSGRL